MTQTDPRAALLAALDAAASLIEISESIEKSGADLSDPRQRATHRDAQLLSGYAIEALTVLRRIEARA
jgi:hypothetical protein